MIGTSNGVCFHERICVIAQNMTGANMYDEKQLKNVKLSP
jgi:hypothetical protein